MCDAGLIFGTSSAAKAGVVASDLGSARERAHRPRRWTGRDAQGLHAKLKATPGDADYAICVLGSLYTRIIVDWELSEMRNPTHGVRRFGSRKVERFLSPEERRRLREAMDTGLRIPPGRRGHLELASVWALQLLSLTGLRRDEILDLHWPSVDWQHNCLRLVDTKTGPRTVPVSSQVMTLRSRFTTRPGARGRALLSTRGPAAS